MTTRNLDEKLAEISTVYIGVREELTSISTIIENIFDKLLLKNASKYDLNYKNSAYPGHYFSFSPRIKTHESLKEKLVRSGELLQLIERDTDGILESLKNMNDLIGIKILGELEEDVISIYKILRENESELKNSGVIFLSNVYDQPVPMNNGLEIYKLNCKYIHRVDGIETSYLFELQIKSKLLSAWGDMEHRIFYKDYLGTAVRNSVQQLMNKVGYNLKTIDDLLHTIRISNRNYLEEKELYLFIEDVQEQFTDKLKIYLETEQNFDLHKIVTLLFDFRNLDRTIKNIDFSSIHIPDLDEHMLNDNYKHLKIFKVLKKYSFNVRILEYIYTSYVFSGYIENETLKDDILKEKSASAEWHAHILYDYLEYYKKIIINKFTDFPIHDLAIEEKYLDEILNFIFANSVSEEVLMLSDKYKMILEFYSNFIAVYNNEFEEDFEEDMLVAGMEQNQVDEYHRTYYYLLMKSFALHVFESEIDFSSYLNAEEVEFFQQQNEEVIEFMKKVYKNIQKNEKLNKQIVQFTNSNSLLGSVNL